MSEWRLEMRNINKSFASMQALSDVQFLLRPGEAHALLGMNGAGKSTLIKILCGAYTKDSGQILIDGQEVQIHDTQDAMNLGIATVYQHPNLVQSFTGYENIFLGTETKGTRLTGKVDRNHLRKEAEQLARKHHVNVIDVTKTVSDMKPVERELISILGALSKESRILILDEPTSILTEKEKATLFNVVKELKKQGVSVIFVTHRLDEVNEICDAITVLRDGKNVDTLRIGDGLDTSFIAELMLGKKINKLYPPKTNRKDGKTVLEVEGLCMKKKLSHVSFSLKTNEILGVFGLVGSGIDELSKVLFGVLQRTEGRVLLNGKEVKFRTPKDAINNNVFLIPGDRQTEGYIGEQDISTNLSMSKIRKICYKMFGIINNKVKKNDALDMIKRLNIATPNEKKLVMELSGGNQQKVVVGKGLYTDAEVYIFTEPTVGVDVGARNSIYEIMRELTDRAVVMLISSDIEEIYGMSDRVMVMNQGHVVFQSDTNDVSLNEILVHAVSEVRTEQKGE